MGSLPLDGCTCLECARAREKREGEVARWVCAALFLFLLAFFAFACHREPPPAICVPFNHQGCGVALCSCSCPDGGVVPEEVQPDGGCQESCLEALQVDCGFGR